MPDQPKVSIPDNHKRSLSVVAHNIENSINDIENLLTTDQQNKLTEKLIRNVNEKEREDILKLAKIVREKNEKMFSELGLHTNFSYEDRIVRSRIGHIWTLLEDSTPESLKGYGELTKEQGDLIRMHVNSLLETVNKLQDIIFTET